MLKRKHDAATQQRKHRSRRYSCEEHSKGYKRNSIKY